MNTSRQAAATRGRPGKREAVTRAARMLFGRDGYARTTTDDIAREAGVSTRTLYKHFGSKEQLFSYVLLDSATRVADAFIEHVEAGLHQAEGLEQQLVAIGRALVAHRVDFPEHFAMVRMIGMEGRHFPKELLEAWEEAGPRRVQAEVTQRLEALADDGLLRITDPRRTALQFTALTTFEATSTHQRITEQEITDAVTAAVHAFLDGFRVRADTDAPATSGGPEASGDSGGRPE